VCARLKERRFGPLKGFRIQTAGIQALFRRERDRLMDEIAARKRSLLNHMELHVKLVDKVARPCLCDFMFSLRDCTIHFIGLAIT